MTGDISSSTLGSSAMLEPVSAPNTLVLNCGATLVESVAREEEVVGLLRCAAAWASRKSFVWATARSSSRDVAASNLYNVR